jgi:hypothetical protein
MHPRCNKQHEMSMNMMLCLGFSASNTRGVTGAAKCGEKGGAGGQERGKGGQPLGFFCGRTEMTP